VRRWKLWPTSGIDGTGVAYSSVYAAQLIRQVPFQPIYGSRRLAIHVHTVSTNISTQLTYIYILSHSQTWQGDIVAEYGGRNSSQLKDGEQKAMDTLKLVYPEVYVEFTRHFRALSDKDGESHRLFWCIISLFLCRIQLFHCKLLFSFT
jgi:hypothetical protein